MASQKPPKPFATYGSSEDRRNCGLCNSSLGEEAIVAMNRLWHPDHFLCNGCHKPIRQTFQVCYFSFYWFHKGKCINERFAISNAK